MSDRYVRVKMLASHTVSGPEIGETVYQEGSIYQIPATLAVDLCHRITPAAEVVDIFASEQDMDSQEASDLLESLQPIPLPQVEEG